MESVAHRQTRYIPAAPFPEPKVLPLPEPTKDLEQAKRDLTEYGLCLIAEGLVEDQIARLRTALSEQARAEQSLGDLAPLGAFDKKLIISNLVNKGADFLALVEHSLTTEIAGYMLGKRFLLSSLTGHMFNGSTERPQLLHRDQGQVPGSVDFPAACNLFYMLDDFTAKDGSTCVIPGSHRWPAEYQVSPPDESLAVQLEAPAGTVFAWDGRLWHGTGVSKTGNPRRNIAVYCCLPWVRQQENWGVTCLQETLDEASPMLKARLGLQSYGTLGQMNGAGVQQSERSLGNFDVVIPDYIIGENATLHPMQRTTRTRVQKED